MAREFVPCNLIVEICLSLLFSVCSVCPDHPWQARQFQPGKHSVFAVQEQEDEDCSPAEIDQQEAASDGCTSLDECDSLQTHLPVATGTLTHSLKPEKSTSSSEQAASPASVSARPRITKAEATPTKGSKGFTCYQDISWSWREDIYHCWGQCCISVSLFTAGLCDSLAL